MNPPTILVVDDDRGVREVLTESLAALGYGTVTAASAEAAMALLQTTTPDLILTDVHMGAMSGIELCARVKADPHLALVPVVILTAVSDLAARVTGLAAGADDGSGYPDGLRGEAIPLGARILAVVDVYDALLEVLRDVDGEAWA